jgi:hypothetical protein
MAMTTIQLGELAVAALSAAIGRDQLDFLRLGGAAVCRM